MSLDLHLNNEQVDLIQGGFDLALRVSSTPSLSLIVKPLASIEFSLVASPDYLRRYGLPRTPEEVNLHSAVLPNYTDMSHVTIYDKNAQPFVLSLSASVWSNDTLMCHRLIQAGCGIGYLPDWLIVEDLQQGSLVRLLPGFKIRSIQLYAAYVERAFLSAKVRTMIDFLSEKVGVS